MLLWSAALCAGLSLLRHNPYQPAVNIAFVVFMGWTTDSHLLLEG
jgi:hypothetical protein